MMHFARQKANSVTTVKCTTTSKPFAVGKILEAMVEATHNTEADTIAVEANLEAVAVAEVTLVAVAEAVAEAAVEVIVEAVEEAKDKEVT